MANGTITTQAIDRIKKDNNSFNSFIQSQPERNVIYLLNKIGRLDKETSKEPFMQLLKNRNENIRALAIKNLAKLGDITLLDVFLYYRKNDESTIVRREAVSGIGRIRNSKTIPSLVECLKDKDPKVVMQAIRGLLVFKWQPNVMSELEKLMNHPNEMVKDVVQREIRNKSSSVKKKVIKLINNEDKLRNLVIQGDVLEVSRYIPEESVHLTFTSPPYYNARDYSIYQSYREYLSFLEKVFKEVYRITKEGRFFVLNTSPIIIPRVSRQHASKRYPIPYDVHPLLIKMGWEFIDDIVWVKPEASVKNRNAGFLQHRKPLAYKPNPITEMLMVYRKKTDKLIDWNIKQYTWEVVNKSKVRSEYETSNVWKIDPTFDRIHSAVFPIELCNRVIKYYSLVGDLIFDPFAGSGTLGRAAINLKRDFLLTEIDKRYINRIREEVNEGINIFNSTKNPIRFMELTEFIEYSKTNDYNRNSN